MKQKLLFFTGIIAVAIAAYFFAVEAAGLLNFIQTDSRKKERNRLRELAVSKMDNIKVGTVLPNYFFYDLESHFTELHKMKPQRTMIVCYITTDCHACEQQLEILEDFSGQNNSGASILLLSPSNPFNLFELRDKLEKKFVILYDHGGYFRNILKISTYPFNIVVDSNFVIKKLVPGRLEKNEIADLLQI